ncbi:MAG: hypothetical protein M3P06_20710 [Acidobacteriota bacterium]|nr:hypothetical protein [Acidobacteriota bacterium]
MTLSCSTLFTPRDLRNYTQFTWWMTAGMLVFAAATILIDGKWIPDSAGWALTVTAIVLMVFTVRAYIHFLRNADELLRKVHLEALAMAFGAGVVAMMGYRLCERLGAPKLDINDPFLVMLLVWVGGQYLGARRYAIAEEQ